MTTELFFCTEIFNNTTPGGKLLHKEPFALTGQA